MKRRNVAKCLLLAGALCIVGGFSACKDLGNPNPYPDIFNTGTYAYTGFLPGAQETYVIGGDGILIKELIDVPANTEYTLTLNDGTTTKDFTNKTILNTNTLGFG